MPPLRRRHSPDYLLISAMVLLLGLGLIVIYSISPVLSHKLLGDVSENHFLYGQLLHVSLGVVAFWLFSNLHYSKWHQLLPGVVALTGLVSMLLLIPGLAVTKNGATRWVDIGFLTFQPAEILKFGLVVLLASQFSRFLQAGDRSEDKGKLKIAFGAFAVAALVVLFLQRDMGTMLVIGTIILGMYFLSGAPIRYIGILGGTALGVGVGSILLFPHRIARLLTYLDPSADPASSGYHLNQALIAIGSGGFLGLGVGKSIQVYGYLPEAANDSIFAIIGETFGFVGGIIILSLFATLIYRCLKIGLTAPDRFSQLLVFGVTLWLASQTLINITAMLGIVPLTGIPLPFLSYGGTSLVVSAAALGIVANVSKYTKRGVYAQNRAFRGRDGRSYHAYPKLRPSSR